MTKDTQISRAYEDRLLFILWCAIFFTGLMVAVEVWVLCETTIVIVLSAPLVFGCGWGFGICMWELNEAARNAWKPWTGTSEAEQKSERDA